MHSPLSETLSYFLFTSSLLFFSSPRQSVLLTRSITHLNSLSNPSCFEPSVACVRTVDPAFPSTSSITIYLPFNVTSGHLNSRFFLRRFKYIPTPTFLYTAATQLHLYFCILDDFIFGQLPYDSGTRRLISRLNKAYPDFATPPVLQSIVAVSPPHNQTPRPRNF